VSLEGERAISHFFVAKTQQAPTGAVLSQADVPAIPQSLELVNQTVSVPREPVSERYTWRQIVEYRQLMEAEGGRLKADFENAVRRYNQMRAKQ